jgi:hypothetical protein
MEPILMAVIFKGGLLVGLGARTATACVMKWLEDLVPGSRLGLFDLLCCCIMASDDGLIGVGIAFACLGFPYDAENVPQELGS